MSIQQLMRARMGDGSMGYLTPGQELLGYREDAAGNIYYPDGMIMSGPAVSAISRGRIVTQLPVNNADPRVAAWRAQGATDTQIRNMLAGRQPNDNGIDNDTPGYLNIFGTKISYTTLIVVGLAVVLLQSKPLRRA